MALFDRYGGVKKHGWQVDEKRGALIVTHQNLLLVESHFSKERSDYELCEYLGDNGLTATYKGVYCSKQVLKNDVLPLLKH